MLTATRQSDSKKVLARQSERVQAPFICPKCRRLLILRKGNIKVHHFSHKPPTNCILGKGETEAHHRAKLDIYDSLILDPRVTQAELEKDLGGSIADVYAKIGGVPVAIEIQRSALSVNEIADRTRRYHMLGIAVLWIGLPNSDLSSQKYTPRAWEKWCHGAYYGRVYYWQQGQTLHVCHFDPYTIHVPSSSWYKDGSEQSAGGYDRFSKRWRIPRMGAPVLITQSFQLVARPAFSQGSVSVPACTVFMDKQNKWWR